jgi:hypothetical protein
VCRLKKALYGIKHAPRAWYYTIDRYLQSMGFTKSEADPKLYFILVWMDPLILVLYMDDVVSHRCIGTYSRCKEDLAKSLR